MHEAADEGLPLEQSFVATLYELLMDHEKLHGAQRELRVDLLGCREALELQEPVRRLSRMLKARP